MLNPHISMIPYNHLHPSPFTLPNGPTYYEASPQSLTTPYHPHYPQILPGLPPHAPLPPQRATNYPQRLSPTLTHTHEINPHTLQQRMLEQQTPISIQRQLHRLPNIDYSQ